MSVSAPPRASSSSTPSRINVLIYDGPGVSPTCLAHTKNALKQLLTTRYDVLTVSPSSLIKDPWSTTCALLIFPGGRDLGYLSSLGDIGARRIKEYVEIQGGRYLGLCAGAYFACSSIEFEVGRGAYEVTGSRPLAFYPGKAKGAAFPGFVYDSEEGARDAKIELESSAWQGVWKDHPLELAIYHNGGGFFEEPDRIQRENGQSTSASGCTVLARYTELPERPPAGMLCTPGSTGGKAVLWAVHPEHPTITVPPSAAPTEEARMRLLRATLQLLDLDIPSETRSITGSTPLLLCSLDPTRASELGSHILAQYATTSGSGRAPTSLQDVNDTFSFYPSSSTLEALLSEKRRIEQTALDLVVCSEGIPPNPSLTPIFNIRTFYGTLQAVRRGINYGYRPSFGDDLLYGEVVTSTQTVLQHNPRFQGALPSGFVFVGSHQIAGRGRGSNSWLSPPGCLQFSLLLRVPSTLGSRLVFLQYLFGLSVVEAVRTLPGFEDVELRLKWPNDIYVDLGTKGGLKKIGGILVNSVFRGNEITVIIGCGINTTNSTPTTSLLDLIRSHNSLTGSSLPIITQEQLLALILSRFEHVWGIFSASSGDFGPFASSYTKRWLHSGKEVMIEATGQRVVIEGLTSNEGYLKTRDVQTGRVVELQPDGNSFDMMQGLLKTKK